MTELKNVKFTSMGGKHIAVYVQYYQKVAVMHRNVVYFHKIQEEAATEDLEGKGEAAATKEGEK